MKVTLIYMAAGNSRRFGANKLLHEIDGKGMYLHLLERLMHICKRHNAWNIVVVTQYQEIYEEVLKYKNQGQPVFPVLSPDSKKGVSYSVHAGLNEVEKVDKEDALTTEACAFFVADQPYLKEVSAENFLKEMERRNASLGCVCHSGRIGNPVWFSRKYFPELLLLEGDRGGRKVLSSHREEAVLFEIGNILELEDIDE